MGEQGRRRNVNWSVPLHGAVSYDVAQLCVLLDIRDELQRLNALLHCHNFTGIPTVLRDIRARLPMPKKPAKRARHA